MKTDLTLSPGQKRVLESLLPLARLATSGVCKRLPYTARTASLIVGPSGIGKSHIARVLAKQLNLPIWEANVANWMVMGSRATKPTLESLATWVADRKSGIIFLDEIDKINGPAEWTNSIRLEVHEILDSRMPENAIVPEGTSDFEAMTDDTTKRVRKEIIKREVEEKLRNSFMVVGAGAWQGGWQENRQAVGFNAHAVHQARIDPRQILQSITPEIRQRFRLEISFLEPMSKSDYQSVAASIIQRLPKTLLNKFLAACVPAIDRALDEGWGMRIFEDVLADVWSSEYEIHRENELAWTYLAKAR